MVLGEKESLPLTANADGTLTAQFKAEHDGFTTKAMELLRRFEMGEEITFEALDFLKEWLVHHICQVDRAYLPFFQAKGLA